MLTPEIRIAIMLSPDRIKALRAGFRLTQAEAAAIVGVSTRTWTSWETGQRVMPDRAFQLFRLRTTLSTQELAAQGIHIKTDENRQLVVLVADDGSGHRLIPWDVVAKYNFLDVLYDAGGQHATVTSLAVTHQNFPYVHRSEVDCRLNRDGLAQLEQWKADRNAT